MDGILQIKTEEVEVSIIKDAEIEISTVEIEVRSTPLRILQHFDPVAHDLDVDFRLMKFSEPRGTACKVPQKVLHKHLLGLMEQDGKPQHGNNASKAHLEHDSTDRIDMDCCVTPLRQGDQSLVQTTDFFYPLCDDPYIMGMVTCANLLSKLYAMGVSECDNILMVIAVSNNMTDNERDIVVPLMVKGFKDCAKNAGTSVTGSQTMINPWLIIGGFATSVYSSLEIIHPNDAAPGDVLILTKPLGTHVAVTVYQWLLNQPERWNKVKHVLTEEEVRKGYLRAVDIMTRLNKVASCLMQKYYARGATHVTEYGLLGHAQNLVKFQKNEVSFVIHNIPLIARMTKFANACGMLPIVKGNSVEISGGLLICFPKVQAAKFIKEFKNQEGRESWIIGKVEKGNHTARVVDKPIIINTPKKEKKEELW